MADEELAAALRVQSRALGEIHANFRDRGFIELMPVVLSTATDPLGPDPGSSVVATPSIDYLGQELVLTQSMILHKQALAAMGVDRFYVVSPNVRLERADRSATGRHLFEFSQVDFEIAHGRMEDVFALVEGVLVSVVSAVDRDCGCELATWGRGLDIPRAPFPRYTTHELEDEFGAGWEREASLSLGTPFWVLCHSREFYDAEDPDRPGHYLNYDLIYPGGFGEALSGAEREWELERILARIDRDGLPRERYAPFLERARGGLVPTAGAGFGVERLTRFLVGADHVGDVQPFRRVPGEKVTL
jgi:asparaginyl-tRNA synthetase